MPDRLNSYAESEAASGKTTGQANCDGNATDRPGSFVWNLGCYNWHCATNSTSISRSATAIVTVFSLPGQGNGNGRANAELRMVCFQADFRLFRSALMRRVAIARRSRQTGHNNCHDRAPGCTYFSRVLICINVGPDVLDLAYQTDY